MAELAAIIADWKGKTAQQADEVGELRARVLSARAVSANPCLELSQRSLACQTSIMNGPQKAILCKEHIQAYKQCKEAFVQSLRNKGAAPSAGAE
jgi:hypothetical protein